MNNRVVIISSAVLDLGILWGITSLLVGMIAGSSLNGINLVQWLLAIFTACIAPIVVAIMAIWTPRTAAVMLAICFLLLEGLALFCDGFHGILLITRRFGIQCILFICAYTYVARLNAATGGAVVPLGRRRRLGNSSNKNAFHFGPGDFLPALC
jgi:hypothetical protein